MRGRCSAAVVLRDEADGLPTPGLARGRLLRGLGLQLAVGLALELQPPGFAVPCVADAGLDDVAVDDDRRGALGNLARVEELRDALGDAAEQVRLGAPEAVELGLLHGGLLADYKRAWQHVVRRHKGGRRGRQIGSDHAHEGVASRGGDNEGEESGRIRDVEVFGEHACQDAFGVGGGRG